MHHTTTSASRVSRTRRFLKWLAAPLLLTALAPVARAQYCTTSLGGICGANDITNVSFNTLNNTSGCVTTAAGDAYESFTASGTATTSVLIGSSYTLTVTMNGASICSVWIDFNHDNIFSSTEWQQVTTNAATASITVAIPVGATAGATGMRVRSRGAGNINGASDACTQFFSGQTEDYQITIVNPTPCSGVPTGGTTVSTPATPCYNSTATLTVTGASINTGITYQWEESTNGGTTWGNATGGSGATTASYTTPALASAIQYRLRLTCTNAVGGTATSSAYSFSPTPLAPPYAETFESITANQTLPPCMKATNLGTLVQSFTTNQTTNNQVNHTPGGSKFVSFRWNAANDWVFTPAINLTAGKTYRASYWYITDGLSGWSNLQFSYGAAQAPGNMTNTLNLIPTPTATTYQQVTTTFTAGATGPVYFGIGCSASFNPNFLTIDDIEVVELPPCSGTPVVTTTPTDSLVTCPTGTFTLAAPLPSVSGWTYQWQQSLNGGTTWVSVAGATSNTYTGAVPNAGTFVYYRLVVTCTNSGVTTNGSPIKVISTAPPYAALPYFNGFETWSDYCKTKDVPGVNWFQPNAQTGNASWRRNDQGASAGWTTPAGGAYSPTAQSGTYSARYHTAAVGGFMTPGAVDEGQLDLYLDCSGATGSKGLYFQQINTQSNLGDSLVVWYSGDAGLTWNWLAGWDTATNWRGRIVNIPSNTATTIVRFAARKWAASDASDIGIDSVYVTPPCTGTPVAGTASPAGPVTGCAGSIYTLSLSGTSMAGNLTIGWEWSTISATAGFAAAPGANTGYQYTTPPVSGNVWVRARVTCGGSGLSAVSNVVAFTLAPIGPAALPFTEDFETWNNRCSTSDVPSDPWTNTPENGNTSWRRTDQGSTAAWTTPASGAWWPASPIAANGANAARFHSFNSTTNTRGRLDLYVNCSGAGNKELQYSVNMNGTPFGSRALLVSYSTNGGATFTQLASILSTTNWELRTQVLPSTSANTIVRFEAQAANGGNDIGLDYVRVLLPCTTAPVAGTIVPVTPCANQSFVLKLANVGTGGGVTYQWQQCTSPTQPSKTSTCWTNIVGATTQQYTTTIPQARWFRAIATCPAGNLRDTTPAYLVQPAPFYQCYCSSGATSPAGWEDIGNVTLRTQPAAALLLDNGNATPQTNNPTAVNAYTSFTSLPPVPLYLDSAYKLFVQQITSSTQFASRVAAWIDYNQDGVFDPVGERVLNVGTSAATVPNYNANGTFTVPGTALTGITGLRIVLQEGATIPNPCGGYTWGETEDYLVDVRYHPCGGPANAGMAIASDTSTCPGYPIVLTDTTYEKRQYGLVRQWQQSTNGGQSWQNIGAANRDTVRPTVTGATLYRLRVLCLASGDSSFSTVAPVSINPPYACYCVSYATGGPARTADSTDVGSFIIGKPVSAGSTTPLYTFNVGGPHLLNPQATSWHTAYGAAANTIELWSDSTYRFEIYQTVNGAVHKDAKVTLFMDFNNNLQYEPAPGNGFPPERVLTAYTSVSNWYLTSDITIPSQQVITDVPTGMRLIINENTAPNAPSDDACGVYTAGETEDYVVVFRKVGGTQGVNSIASLKSLGLYPNPTSGKTTLAYTADKAIRQLDVTVTNMTGQVMLKQSFPAPGRQFSTELDLSDRPRGVYFIELQADGEKAVRKLVVR